MDKAERIAVLIPCYNEEMTIAKVIDDFRHELPNATIFVCDNCSTDQTRDIALSQGAIVLYETQKGKGNAVRKLFTEIDADFYVLVDGDDTYPASEVHRLIKEVRNGADMACGDRISNGRYGAENKRIFHGFGNDLVKVIINALFHSNIHDAMTGYRVFSRRFVKNFPVLSSGFEIETEMTLHALNANFPISEEAITYRDRPKGSHSKLRTLADGRRVLTTIFLIFKDYRPMPFFDTVALIVCLLGVVCGLPAVLDYYRYHYVYHVPLSILAAAMEMLAVNLFTCGVILDTIVKIHKREYMLALLHYSDREKMS